MGLNINFIDEYLKDIFKKYSIMIKKNLNELNFLINGNNINNFLTIKEINNKDNCIEIFVYENKDKYNNKSLYHSNYKKFERNKEDEYINLYNYKISFNKEFNILRLKKIFINFCLIEYKIIYFLINILINI